MFYIRTTNILLFLILVNIPGANNLFAQKELKEQRYRKIYLSQGEKKVEAGIALNEQTKTREENTYYWYDNNTIHQTQGSYSGYLLDGEYNEYTYPENKLAAQGQYKKGLKNNKWIYWYENGNIRLVENWKKGKLNGEKRLYAINGQVERTEHYHKGSKKEELTTGGTGEQKPRQTSFWKKLRHTLYLDHNAHNKAKK